MGKKGFREFGFGYRLCPQNMGDSDSGCSDRIGVSGIRTGVWSSGLIVQGLAFEIWR